MPSLHGTVVGPIDFVGVVAAITASLDDDKNNGPENEEADSDENDKFGCHKGRYFYEFTNVL
jgi:hypothetical protein